MNKEQLWGGHARRRLTEAMTQALEMAEGRRFGNKEVLHPRQRRNVRILVDEVNERPRLERCGASIPAYAGMTWQTRCQAGPEHHIQLEHARLRRLRYECCSDETEGACATMNDLSRPLAVFHNKSLFPAMVEEYDGEGRREEPATRG